MLKYVNGKILKQAIPNETTLVIKLAKKETDQSHPMNEAFPVIMKEYAKYITAICLIGGEDEQYELTELFKQIRKAGLKTCLSTYLTEQSQLNLNLLNELDYLQLGTKMYKKDYCPLLDVEDWIVM